MDVDENSEEEEINLDFSKIKNIFKKKTETKKGAQEKPTGPQEKPKTDEVTPASPKPPEDEEKEDEEIDFGKITKFFKKSTKTKSQGPKEEPSEKEDEEINIDFGKIKKIFKDKDEKEVDAEGEEISFDIKKIKGFFKGFKEKKADDEEELSLDARKTMAFFGKYKKFIIPTLLIIIAVSFSVYLRIQPAHLPVTDDWAKSAVYNQIRSSISVQINQQYPNLPGENRDSLVEAQFQKVLQEQKSQIDPQIEATSNYFKSRLQDDAGQTYLLAIDPYFWMRHAMNILKNGHPGDELRDGKPYNTHMFAPVGRFVPKDMFHAYFEAYLYKFVSFFNRNIELMKVAFYIPVLLSALCVFPAFFIGRRFAGNFGGFISAFVIAIHPSFLTRTAGGFADTDAYNVLFPLLITWLFLEAFETKDKKRMVIYSSLAGLFVGLFSFSWGGWFYIFDFLLAASVFYIFYFVILHRHEAKELRTFMKKPALRNAAITILVFFIVSAVFTTIFRDFGTFTDSFINGPLSFATLKQVAITTVWPNVYTTVAEQNPAGLDSVISQIGIGSILLFLISLAGIAIMTLKKGTKRVADLWFLLGAVIWFLIILGIKPQNLTIFLSLIALPIAIKLILIVKERQTDVDIKAAILLILWFIATIYASVKGVRFTLLAVPAFAIALGVALGISYNYLHSLITKGLKINHYISKALVIILLIFLLLGPYRSALATAKNEIPSMNDEWYQSLDKINREGAPDAIINSWWDFGHWFKMIGDRGVTFDGTSQNSPNAHWIGSVLLTDNEDYAVGTLRMVDCGQNQAFDKLNSFIQDAPRSIDIIENIVALEKEGAKAFLLENGLTDTQADAVLQYSHCTPPEDYFITSYDMIGKSGVWAHFGAWDFNRALIYNTLKEGDYKNNLEKSTSFLRQRFNYTEEEAQSLYYEVQTIASDAEANSWIAPWPSYGGAGDCESSGESQISCDIGQGARAEINLSTLQADIQTPQGVMHPDSIVLPLENGTYKERTFNNTVGISITLVPVADSSYRTLLLHPALAKSMFTIMFYLNGHGLTHFEKFSDVTDITGGRIIVWKVNWQGNATNMLEYYQPEPVLEEPETAENNTLELEKSIETTEDITNKINASDADLEEVFENISEPPNNSQTLNTNQDNSSD
jgi:asparagine N-glycosylation enzyme membrane subunit Stt3